MVIVFVREVAIFVERREQDQTSAFASISMSAPIVEVVTMCVSRIPAAYMMRGWVTAIALERCSTEIATIVVGVFRVPAGSVPQDRHAVEAGV